MSEFSPIAEFILVVVIAPLVETFLVQYLPIAILIKYTKAPSLLIIIISAACFSLLHTYSLAYVTYTFLSGLMLAFAFVVFYIKKNSFLFAFLMVCLVHAVFNAGLFSLKYCSQ